jgi:hypothetical protein
VNARAVAAFLALQSGVLVALAPSARALPPPEPPRGLPTVSPTPLPPNAEVLPYGSTLQLVLDDTLDSSHAPAGSVIRVHLRDPLVLAGRTIAPAGDQTTMTIVVSSRAQSGDFDGSVQIHVNPLPLLGAGSLPVRAPHEFLAIDRSTGELSTRDVGDMAGNIFIPGYIVYQIFRKGRNFKLGPGSVFSVLTAASVDATNPRALTVSTPPPFVINGDMPHADLTPIPLYTIPPTPPPKPKATRTPTPPTPGPPSPSPVASTPAAPSANLPSPNPTGSR